MTKATADNRSLRKRLAPLYVALFLHGFVFWYAIEKLFMTSIGYDEATIGLMGAVLSVVMLLAETPSGLLADRWSRKGVLILASVALALSALVGGMSTGLSSYLVSAAFWGLFFALYSGTYDSVVYDTLLEHMKDASRFEYYLGRLKVVDSIALVLGSVIGGLTAHYFGLRETYLLSVPAALLSVAALVAFKEPQLHKSETAVSVRQHIRTTFTAVLGQKQLQSVLAVLVIFSAVTYLLYEFNQLWTIALAAPVLLFGPINAILLSTIGIGGAAAGYLGLGRRPAMMAMLSVLLLATAGLALFRNLPLIVLCMSILGACLVALNVVFNKFLHDSLDSKVRAGAASTVSTLGRTLIIPLSLVFGLISRETNVFYASWLLVVLSIVGILFVVRTYNRLSELPGASLPDESMLETYAK